MGTGVKPPTRRSQEIPNLEIATVSLGVYPMTDPWDERYIYLRETHRNQRFM